MKESKYICRKVSFFAGEQKHKYMKESKNVSRKTNIGEEKQKYLQENKFIYRKAKIFKAQQKYLKGSKNIFAGKQGQKILEGNKKL